MKNSFSNLLKYVGLLGIPLASTVNYATPEPQIKPILQSQTSEQNLSRVDMEMIYDGGEVTCKQPMNDIDVRCYAEYSTLIKFEPIVYGDLKYVQNYIMKRILGFEQSDPRVRNFVVDYSNNTWSFNMDCIFWIRCRSEPVEVPGSITAMKKHYHVGGLDVKKVGQLIPTTGISEYLRDTRVTLKFDKNWSSWSTPLSSFSFWNVIKMDPKKIFRGFNANYFGISVSDDYLKALIITNACRQALEKIESENLQGEPGYSEIYDLVKEGRLIDYDDPYTQILLDKELKGIEKLSFQYWVDRIRNKTIDLAELEKIPLTKISQAAKYYGMPYESLVPTSFVDYIFSGNLPIEVTWSTSLTGEQKTNVATINYIESKNTFALLENGEEFIIRQEDETNEMPIFLHSVKIEPNPQLTREKAPLYIRDLQGTSWNFDESGYYMSNPKFKINKFLSVETPKSAFDWIELLGINKYTELDENGIPLVLSNPEILIQNQEYVKSMLQFSTPKSALKIYDKQTNAYLSSETDTLYKNSKFNEYITKFEVKAFNSKNVVTLNIWWKDIDANGNLKSDEEIFQKLTLDLTPHTITNSTFTTEGSSIINIKDECDAKTLTKLILDQYIEYGDTAPTEQNVVSTLLDKNDWITNAFVDLVVLERDGLTWTCNISYKDAIFKNEFAEQTPKSFEFKIIFEKAQTETILPPTLETSTETVVNYKKWIILGSSILAIILILLLIIIFRHTAKKKAKLFD